MRSFVHASRGQLLHKKLLAEDEKQHHGDQRQHRHGEHITSLCKLILAEKSIMAMGRVYTLLLFITINHTAGFFVRCGAT